MVAGLGWCAEEGMSEPKLIQSALSCTIKTSWNRIGGLLATRPTSGVHPFDPPASYRMVKLPVASDVFASVLRGDVNAQEMLDRSCFRVGQ